jgi:hypothetical protein
VTRLLDFDFDTRTEVTANEGPAANVQTRTSAGAALFRHMVRSLLSAPALKRASLRQSVIRRLLGAREPYSCIDELLDTCSSPPTVDRLDIAIDVLSGTGDLAIRYAWDYLIRDVQQWNPYSSRAYEPNDDHWYILLRAVSRCAVPEDARLRMICACKNAARRGIVEAVVEALGDLASEGSREILRTFVNSHTDPFIRNLAAEVLADVE